MQSTRRQIIDALNERGSATVDELAHLVALTPMAVRHHLNVLQAEKFITASTARRKTGPGRPSQVYSLTDNADTLFPTDYSGLTDYVLDEMLAQVGQEKIIQIFEGIADRMIGEAPSPKPNQTIEERLDELIGFLNKKGFISEWQSEPDGYLIHAYSCPYRRVVKNHEEVCLLDARIIGSMLNVVPNRTSCLRASDDHCTYHISKPIELCLE